MPTITDCRNLKGHAAASKCEQKKRGLPVIEFLGCGRKARKAQEQRSISQQHNRVGFHRRSRQTSKAVYEIRRVTWPKLSIDGLLPRPTGAVGTGLRK